MISQLEPVLAINKKSGQTPLEVLNELRQKKPEYKDARMTYAGRLDPLAEGVLLVVINDEIAHKDTYLTLPKTYEIEVLLGIETDTYDVLGMIQNIKVDTICSPDEIKHVVASRMGTFKQTYPRYSSKTVRGKPLFAHARAEGIADKDIPLREVTITSIDIHSIENREASSLLESSLVKINSVKGDFRQKEISNSWESMMKPHIEKGITFQLIACTVSCSQGTYMRTLAHEIGKTLGTGAIAYSIKRTKVGDFSIEEALLL